MRIAVAFSGGKDSSVTAILLRRMGFDVVLYHALLLSENVSSKVIEFAKDNNFVLRVIDLRDEFDNVMRYTAEAYYKAKTPNPCAVCNRLVKFGALKKEALKECELFATGHYAKVENDLLFRTFASGHNDQSYFLAWVGDFSNLLFPLFEYSSKDVVALYESFYGKFVGKVAPPKSQDACFMKDGLIKFLNRKLVEYGFVKSLEEGRGKIVNEWGEILGEHDGYWQFTVGQRKGLGKHFYKQPKHRFYVKSIDYKTKEVIVAPFGRILAQRVILEKVLWYLPLDGENYLVKFRHSQPLMPAKVIVLSERELELQLYKKSLISPGQLGVIYDGDKVLASGFVREIFIG